MIAPRSGAPPAKEISLLLGDVPGAVQEAVADLVARLGVLDEGVDRLAVQRPLLEAVVARDEGSGAHRLGAVRGQRRRPVLGALAVARRLAGGVLVEGVEGHALGGDVHAVAGLGGGARRLGGEGGAGGPSSDSDRGGNENKRFQHGISLARAEVHGEGDAAGAVLFRPPRLFSSPGRVRMTPNGGPLWTSRSSRAASTISC